MYYTHTDLELSYRITKKEFKKGLRDTINHYRKRIKGECKRDTLEKHDKYCIVEDIDLRKEHNLGVEQLGRYFPFNFENKDFRDCLLDYYIEFFAKTNTQIEKAITTYYFNL